MTKRKKRVNITLFLFCSFLPVTALGGPKSPVGISCSTQEFASTLYELRPTQNGMQLLWKHFNGPDFIPIYEGVVVPYEIPRLARKAEIFKKLGTSQEFSFPLEECKEYGPLIIRCGNPKGPPQDINGHKVKAISTYSSREVVSNFTGTYETHTVTLFLDIDGEKMFVSAKYGPGDCKSP